MEKHALLSPVSGAHCAPDALEIIGNLLRNIGLHGELSNASGDALYSVHLGAFPSEVVAQQAFSKVSHQGYPQTQAFSGASPAR